MAFHLSKLELVTTTWVPKCIPIATTYRDIAESIFRLDEEMYDWLFQVFSPEEVANNGFPISLL